MQSVNCTVDYRINLPKRHTYGAEDEEGEGGVMKNSGSSEQLDADGDTSSEVSSEVSFSYEFAQTEVLMKALGNNGEEVQENSEHLMFWIDRTSVCFNSHVLTSVTSDPMQAVLQSLERQHEEEKRSALERQRQMYETELQQLRKKLNPDRLSTGPSLGPASVQQGSGQQSHYRSLERLSMGGMSHSTSAQSRLRQWTEDRWEDLYIVCPSGHLCLLHTSL